jgi:hypothetical protein
MVFGTNRARMPANEPVKFISQRINLFCNVRRRVMHPYIKWVAHVFLGVPHARRRMNARGAGREGDVLDR